MEENSDTVYEQHWAELDTPVPISDRRFSLSGTEWLPKTDWGRDHIIASDDH